MVEPSLAQLAEAPSPRSLAPVAATVPSGDGGAAPSPPVEAAARGLPQPPSKVPKPCAEPCMHISGQTTRTMAKAMIFQPDPSKTARIPNTFKSCDIDKQVINTPM